MKNNSFFLKLALLLLLLMSMPVPAATNEPAQFEKVFDDFEHYGGRIYTMVDEKGEVIMRTARQIVVGDEFINRQNHYYRVKAVEGERARAVLVEKIVLAEPTKENFLQRVDRLLRNAIPVQQGEGEALNRRIGIYNSHGAEAYIEGDGAESQIEGGGILDVGDELAKALERRGVEVIRSRETHVPHDAGAYQRSRRTVEEILKQNPDAIIDVHRDAVPKEEYLEKVEGQERVQIQLVVGRQNQNIAPIRAFAEGLKKQSDEKFPGLIRGIFMARGNYNQDMSPRAILIEVGSHTNQKEQALESMNLFAEVITAYKYGGAANGQAAAPGTDVIALRSVLWVVLGLIAVVGVFLLVSTGGFKQLKQKLGDFKNKEFTNTLGLPHGEDRKREAADCCAERKAENGEKDGG